MGDITGALAGRAFGWLRLGLAALAGLWIAAPAAQAEDMWAYQYQWYEPEPRASVDQAASTIISLQKFFTLYGGMNIDQIVVTREGLAIHASETTIQSNNQYVPSYGGSWVGNQYVPYYGGTTVTSQVPVTAQGQAYVSYKDLNRVGLLYFPGLRNHWGVDFIGREPAYNVTLRTSDEGLARQFANAALTLMKAANPAVMDNFDELGLWGTWNDGKAFKKAKYKGTGFYVTQVARGGPAERAGVQKGDIWNSINGKAWTDQKQLGELIGPAHDSNLAYSFDLQVLRDKQPVPLRLTAKNFRVANRLITNPWMLGVNFRELTGEDPLVPGATAPAGVMIRAVTETTLAARMDIRPRDILFELNGAAVANGEGLTAIIKAGNIASAKVLRDGAVVELQAPPPAAPKPPAATPERLGLAVREIPAAQDRPAYVEVASVEPGLAAAKLDLRAGDKLIEVNGKTVATTADLASIVAGGPVVTAKVERAGVVVPLGGVTRF